LINYDVNVSPKIEAPNEFHWALCVFKINAIPENINPDQFYNYFSSCFNSYSCMESIHTFFILLSFYSVKKIG